MANFEEKILAYLDGSLSEADREDVLDGISGERIVGDAARSEERDLFNAHLRLQNIYSAVRTPVSAPLSVQRELAAQIPVLAIKLPYLAAENERRDKFAAGWLSSIRSSWVNVFLLLMLLLLAGGIWYVVSNNTHHGSALNANSSSSVNGSIPGNGSTSATSNAIANGSTIGGSSTNGATNTPSVNAPRNISSSNVRPMNVSVSHSNARASRVKASNADILNSSPTNSSAAVHRSSNNNANGPASYLNNHPAKLANTTNFGSAGNGNSGKSLAKKSSENSNALSDRNNSSSNSAKETTATNATPSNSSAVTPAASINSDANQPSSTNLSANGNSAKAAEPPDLLPLPLHTVDVVQLPIANPQPSEIQTLTTVSEDSETYTPLRISLNSSVNVLLERAPAMSSGLRDNRISTVSNGTPLTGYDLGVDYEINPWITIGLHGGAANFAHYQSFVYQPELPGGTFLPEWYRETAISSQYSNWIGARIGYTVNPQSTFRYEFAATVGNVFSTSNSLLGKGELNFYYDIGSRGCLYLGAMLQAAQLSPLSDDIISPVANSTIGIVNIGPQAQRTWFLTAGEQFGFVLHL